MLEAVPAQVHGNRCLLQYKYLLYPQVEEYAQRLTESSFYRRLSVTKTV